MEYFLSFENSGEIDPRLITTMGANVKEHDSPIGYFGTGLKYAIAVILRNGGRVVVQSGESEYEFEARKEVMRGKEFSVVWMTGAFGAERMGITLEVGKNWECWQAYRELYCNMLDERGEMECTNVYPVPTAGITRVLAFGDAMQKAHYERKKYILDAGEPLAKVGGLEIYGGMASGVFYRGIRVYSFPFGVASQYTYNITASLVLTEDRTASQFHVDWELGRGIGLLENPLMIRRIVKADKNSYEGKLSYFGMGGNPSRVFREVSMQCMRENLSELNASLASILKGLDAKAGNFAVATLSPMEVKQLERAVAFLERRRIPVTFGDVKVTESLGKGCWGAMIDEQIWLSREAFSLGTKVVAGTIMEEWAHKRHGFEDESRDMQNWLINLAMGWGEEIDGEAL